MTLIAKLKEHIKKRDTKLSKFLYKFIKSIYTLDIPPIWFIHKPLHTAVSFTITLALWIIRTFYWKPVFLTQLKNKPRRIRLEGVGIPFRLGPLNITIGDDCRIAARIALIGRAVGKKTPQLIIGNNVGIGWRTGIYVGSKIILGDNVRIAGEGSLSGYAGHPLNAKDRACGKPDTDDQAKDIVLENDVWLGRGVIVNGGVTIGAGTIVGAGSVVTKDLPPGVLAGGVPAKVIRSIELKDQVHSVSVSVSVVS